ncbi:hypothetical protein [Myxococcus xanthus]|uniref:hypothetical protein n=1 Tax=Myxococcus xanthus TaxID=34 RepID=UPI0015760E4D|nr:hypothetical protein [Myxococcus xanthus]
MPAVGALGVEGHFPGGQYAALDGVNLPDEFALSWQGDVAALEANLEVGGLALLGFVGEALRHYLREVAGEIHSDAAAVDGEEAPQVGLLLGEGDALEAAQQGVLGPVVAVSGVQRGEEGRWARK